MICMHHDLFNLSMYLLNVSVSVSVSACVCICVYVCQVDEWQVAYLLHHVSGCMAAPPFINYMYVVAYHMNPVLIRRHRQRDCYGGNGTEGCWEEPE